MGQAGIERTCMHRDDDVLACALCWHQNLLGWITASSAMLESVAAVCRIPLYGMQTAALLR